MLVSIDLPSMMTVYSHAIVGAFPAYLTAFGSHRYAHQADAGVLVFGTVMCHLDLSVSGVILLSKHNALADVSEFPLEYESTARVRRQLTFLH